MIIPDRDWVIWVRGLVRGSEGRQGGLGHTFLQVHVVGYIPQKRMHLTHCRELGRELPLFSVTEACADQSSTWQVGSTDFKRDGLPLTLTTDTASLVNSQTCTLGFLFANFHLQPESLHVATQAASRRAVLPLARNSGTCRCRSPPVAE